VLFGTDYSSGRCPSAAATSKALGTPMSLKSSRLNGYEFDCNYANGSDATAQVSYLYDGQGSLQGMVHELDGLVGKSNLTYIPNLGSAAWVVRGAHGGISVLARAHGYGVSVVSNVANVAGETKLERIAVDDWSR
jgi:hypothetical protein